MRGLTERQKKILQVISKSVEKNGYPPTYQQLCDILNISSKNAIKKHMDALVKKGYIERDSSPRGLNIFSKTLLLSGTEYLIIVIGLNGLG